MCRSPCVHPKTLKQPLTVLLGTNSYPSMPPCGTPEVPQAPPPAPLPTYSLD